MASSVHSRKLRSFHHLKIPTFAEKEEKSNAFDPKESRQEGGRGKGDVEMVRGIHVSNLIIYFLVK